MSPRKLYLKRTPAEQAERDLRKARKAAKSKRRHSSDDLDDYDHGPKRKRQRAGHAHPDAGWDAVVDSDAEYGPQPASSSTSSGSHRAHKPDYDYIRAEVEEERFRGKLWDAMGDDERLDSVEASLNSYAHVPRRWRGGGMERMDDELDIDPQHMEDEDYAEWVRAGMWRKKHAEEHEEQMRRQAEHKARREREKAIREETKRLERAAEEERKKRRCVRERLRTVEARELYETRWKALLVPGSAVPSAIAFADIPWPIMAALASSKSSGPTVVRLEDLTLDAISAFLLPSLEGGVEMDAEALKKERREKLRETMLRFHPDKFEGRIMPRVLTTEREVVREAVGVVARALNTMMGEGK